MKKFIFGLMTVLMTGGLLTTNLASAAGSHVQFVGGAENFVFYDDSGDTDLFDGLHDVMAGDKRTETITIQNTAHDYDYVKIYLDSVTIPDGSANSERTVTVAEFLANFTMNIWHGDNLIYSGVAENLDTFVSNVDLGTYYPNDKSTLTVELVAPESLTNRFAHCSAKMDWTFLAEAYKDGQVVPISPDTGYSTGERTATVVFSVVGVVVISGIMFVFWKKKIASKK